MEVVVTLKDGRTLPMRDISYDKPPHRQGAGDWRFASLDGTRERLIATNVGDRLAYGWVPDGQ